MAGREPLSKSRVLSVALALADEHGVGGLTIRALAERLGVKPMAVYHHVPNKEAILDGLVDAVFTEVTVPPEALEWRAGLADRARSLRSALVRHPWALALLESRVHPGPATLTHHDAMLGRLRSAGFSVRASGHAYALLDAYVYGFALQEASLPFGPDGGDETASAVLAGMGLERYPHLVEFTTERVLQPGYAFADEFEVGLEVVLDGLERFRGQP